MVVDVGDDLSLPTVACSFGEVFSFILFLSNVKHSFHAIICISSICSRISFRLKVLYQQNDIQQRIQCINRSS